MKRHVTIKDVARAAGVAPSTVSYVLNGSRVVTAETTRAVLEAVDQLKYRPNPTAQGLVSGSYRTIGVVSAQIYSQYRGHVVAGIHSALRGTGYHPIVSGIEDFAEPDEVLETVMGRGVDALIFHDHFFPPERIEELHLQMPVICVAREIDGIDDRSVLVDEVNGGYLATRHLIELGHTRIAHFVADHHFQGAAQRLAGYRKALQEAGIPFDPALVLQGDNLGDSGMRLAYELLESGVPVTAIFAANDYMAYGAILALHRRGLRVPEHMSVVGYDDEHTSGFYVPPLTTIRQEPREMGRTAAEAVLKLLRGEVFRTVVTPTRLIVRESTAPRAHAD